MNKFFPCRTEFLSSLFSRQFVQARVHNATNRSFEIAFKKFTREWKFSRPDTRNHTGTLRKNWFGNIKKKKKKSRYRVEFRAKLRDKNLYDG